MTTVLNARINNINQPRVRAISYGGKFAMKQATDLNFPSFADGDLVAYQANTQTFVGEAISDITIVNLDAGYF